MVHSQDDKLAVSIVFSSHGSHADKVYRMRFRKEANQADNRAATVSVDSLINYEAVKVSLQ